MTWGLCVRTLGLVVLLGGCSKLIPKAAPPVFYELEYTPPAVMCPQPFNQDLRIWDFTAPSPYDSPQMVVLKEEHQVQPSNIYAWVQAPGPLVAGKLIHDLGASGVFAAVTGAQDPAHHAFEMSGRIFVFAWDTTGGQNRAVLEAEISVVRATSAAERVFNQRYQLSSPARPTNTSNAFAEAMSQVAMELSQRLAQDLCSAAGQATSS